MSPRKAPPDPPQLPLALLVSRQETRTRIEQQIEKGKALASTPINSEEDLDKARADVSRWEKFTEELLKRLFTNQSLAEEFMQFYGSVSYVDADLSFYEGQFREDVVDHVNPLESMVERLELLPEPAAVVAAPVVVSPGAKSRKVFVVHGHDETARLAVSRFLERLRLHPIVLHEQANKGKTLIEKFLANSDVAFAVVIMTADDVGEEKSKRDALRARARQNVIFELGFFIGKIGRENVCALYEEGVELPSDYGSVAYVSMRPGGGWELEVARELRAAGIEVDLNLLT